MVYPRRIARVVRAFEYGARGRGIESTVPHTSSEISFFITCTSQLVYILMIYIHLILQTCMSSTGWSRGMTFQYDAGGHGIDARTLQNYFLILVLDIRIFCLFDNYFFNLEINKKSGANLHYSYFCKS